MSCNTKGRRGHPVQVSLSVGPPVPLSSFLSITLWHSVFHMDEMRAGNAEQIQNSLCWPAPTSLSQLNKLVLPQLYQGIAHHDSPWSMSS